MKDIITYIDIFYKKEFRWIYFLLIASMLGMVIYLNYWHGLEKTYVAGNENGLTRFFGYYLLYFIPFSIAFLLQSLLYKDHAYYRSSWFWMILLLAPAFFSFRVNFNFLQPWIDQQWSGIDHVLYSYCINWVLKVFVLLAPVFITWWIKDKDNLPFYGTRSLDSIRPYFLMLLIMVPLIVLAATQHDFLQMYPKAKALNPISFNSFSGICKYLLFELCYGFDFVSIEFFFRGFLILALVHSCGMHCIIPVACFYCTIHLGKPMGEAVSSFFGGILLGIVSYNTKSIWGGLLVHLGIAWMMEVSGSVGHFLQR